MPQDSNLYFSETDEKVQLRKSLETVIERTYDLEREYKLLKKSMESFQGLLSELIESQPNPIWIVEKAEEAQTKQERIFFQNSAARRLETLLEKIDFTLERQEIENDDRIYLVQINDVGEEERRTIVSATDITEQKRSERLASMGRIAAHLAHEIRNPIGSIALLASTLSRRVDAKEQPLVAEIESAIARVERIIKSTLLFTKGVGISPAPFPLERLQREIENSFEGYAYTKTIDLHIDFEETTLRGDFELLSIVMQNFLYNAIDAIEEDEAEEGSITFRYAREGEYDTITITDSGVAIADADILYEPFKTTKLKGHGLGLALSLEIVKAHNGKIALLKETKGFKIYLQCH